MNAFKRSPQIEKSFTRIRTRLAAMFSVSFTPFLIPVGFVSLLLVFVLLETNQRVRSRATPPEMVGVPAKPTSFWYSIAPNENGLEIVSIEGDTFLIENKERLAGLAEFGVHLAGKKKLTIEQVAISNRMTDTTFFVTLAVDERLTYSHIRPVIYALAEAGITRYGFEGRVLEH